MRIALFAAGTILLAAAGAPAFAEARSATASHHTRADACSNARQRVISPLAVGVRVTSFEPCECERNTSPYATYAYTCSVVGYVSRTSSGSSNYRRPAPPPPRYNPPPRPVNPLPPPPDVWSRGNN